ncbi:MAG TPA: tetratricopeptide repeat protein [Gammaproteobacteria bacterium]|jgi:Flp pilus assembly protein TadD|nr:tetratricopeptide repeat protein [Gammaproteobacteria bacterium]
MSLINNMLKELQKRESNLHFSSETALILAKHKKPFFQLEKKVFILALIALLSLFCGLHFFKYITSKHTVTQTTFSHVVENELIPVKEEDAKWLAPVTISALAIQVKENITEVSFLLDHPALYRVVADSPQHFAIVFDHADCDAGLPPIQYLHTAIQHITKQNINGDIRFDFFLLPNTTINAIDLSREHDQSALVLRVENHLFNKANQRDPESTIKTPAMFSMLSAQYQQALSEAEKGNYQSAIAALTMLLKANPGYQDARVSLAALLLDQNKQVRANLVIDQGLSRSPDYVPYIELKARLLTQAGNIQQALVLLKTASPALTENPEYHAFIAALYERTNQDKLAARIYRELLTLWPQNGNWWFGLGLSLDKMGQGQAAKNAYTKALMEGHLNTSSVSFLENRLQSLERITNATE